MLYEVLKIVVLVFGPIAAYAAFRLTLEVPELVVALPAAAQRMIEAAGVLLVVGAWLLAPLAPFSAAMTFVGLVLLVTPLGARKLSQFKGGSLRA